MRSERLGTYRGFDIYWSGWFEEGASLRHLASVHIFGKTTNDMIACQQNGYVERIRQGEPVNYDAEGPWQRLEHFALMNARADLREKVLYERRAAMVAAIHLEIDKLCDAAEKRRQIEESATLTADERHTVQAMTLQQRFAAVLGQS